MFSLLSVVFNHLQNELKNSLNSFCDRFEMNLFTERNQFYK